MFPECQFAHKAAGRFWLPKCATKTGKHAWRSREFDEVVLLWWCRAASQRQLLDLTYQVAEAFVFTRCSSLECTTQCCGHAFIRPHDALSLDEQTAGEPLEQPVRSQVGVYSLHAI